MMAISPWIKLIFGIGAGIMYAPFYLLGMKDYYLVSIIVCLIALPLICNLSFVYTCLRSRGWWRIGYAILSLLSFGVSYAVYMRYFAAYGMQNIGDNKMTIFNLCKEDLETLAKYLGTDYFSVNIWIYMVLFPLILLGNFLVIKLTRENQQVGSTTIITSSSLTK